MPALPEAPLEIPRPLEPGDELADSLGAGRKPSRHLGDRGARVRGDDVEHPGGRRRQHGARERRLAEGSCVGTHLPEQVTEPLRIVVLPGVSGCHDGEP